MKLEFWCTSPGGKLLKTIANQYPEVHSLHYSAEGGDEFFYATVQKGTPAENWLVIKDEDGWNRSAKDNRPRGSRIQTAE